MTGIIAVIDKTRVGNSFLVSKAIVNQMFKYINYKISSFESEKISLKILSLDNDYHGILQISNGIIAWYGRPYYNGNSITKENVDELSLCHFS